MILPVDLLFHVVNTVLLSLVLTYLFRRFAKEPIQQAMIFEQVSQSNMRKLQDQMRKQEQHLIRAYYHHNYVYEELSHKVDLWRQRVAQQEAHMHAASHALDEKIHERHRQQQEYIHIVHLCKVAVPRSQEKAGAALVRYFESSSQHRASYLERAIESLEKGAL